MSGGSVAGIYDAVAFGVVPLRVIASLSRGSSMLFNLNQKTVEDCDHDASH
jgi:hypothetical protein